MIILVILFYLLQCFFAFYLVYPFLLYLLAGLRNPNAIITEKNINPADYAIIVTAYEQTTLIPSVVDSILKLNYNNYLVYVVADNCDITGLVFDDSKVIILRPEEVLASNTRSHFYAINNFKREHDRLTIIDSDNLVHPEYLNELNKLFDQDYCAVQGVRKAKNLNSTYACLDEAGDIYYRYIDRKLLFDAGSSASLAGSGMAFTTSIYISCLGNRDLQGAGFDKIFQYELVKRKLKIGFAEQAIVYDEKTAKSEQLVKQRARWINTWFKFLILGAKLKLTGVFSFNRNQVLFSLMLLRPPLFILVIMSGLFFLVSIFISPFIALAWIIAFVLFISMFGKALSYFKADAAIYKSLKNIPKFIYFQVLALLKANKANELSVATKHEHQSNINDLNT